MPDLNRPSVKFTRSAQRVANMLGVIPAGDLNQAKKFRNPDLDVLDAYYEARQYDQLVPWEQTETRDSEFVPIRKRKPRINFNLAKAMVDRVAAKLVGENVFPQLKVEEDPDTEAFLAIVQKASKLKTGILDPIKDMLTAGSSLVRFYVSSGTLKIEGFKTKYCYPIFQDNGELESVRVQYVYTDPEDKDANGKPRQKWYRLDLGTATDILYDNPEYNVNSMPQFLPVSTVQHDLGFVQAEWLRTAVDKHTPDGYSLIEDILDFIDELCYSLSQSSQATSYGQEPQLVLTGLDDDERESLIKSSLKAWSLGKDGKAEFLNNDLTGVEKASELREKMLKNVGDVTRIIMMDPEKMVGAAQSAKAMEVLMGPLVELINELRPMIEDKIQNIVLKMAMTILEMNNRGLETGVVIPVGYQPKSLNVSLTWPPIFPMTMQDLLQKVQVAAQVSGASLISRESLTRWLAKDFGIENVDEELSKITSQPVLNPFGTFGGM